VEERAHTTDIELVLSCFDAFRARDVEALLEMLAPDVEVRSLMTEAERIHYHGHDGVRAWLAAVLDIFPDWTPKPAVLTQLDGAVLVEMDVTATAVASGARIDQRFWMAATLGAGKVTWYGFFRTEADALATVRERD
jgi:ketosteroid isomerase-like protein